MVDRRAFVTSALFAGVSVFAVPTYRAVAQTAASTRARPDFPRQDPALVQQVVAEAHRSLDAVRELVERTPELAKAAWDWGFGDWETPLGAASHTGRHEIADYLLSRGARPSLFSAAMLGQLEVVRAFVEATPGIQGVSGPHGITLLAHARAGGQNALPVVAYLETVGGADPVPAQVPIEEAELASREGRYVFGTGEDEVLDVEVRRGSLSIGRPGFSRRNLFHLGEDSFYPAGAPSVRIRLDAAGSLQLEAGGEVLRAKR